MDKIKRTIFHLVLLSLIILVILGVPSFALEYKVIPIKYKIYPDEIAEYKINLTNTGNLSHRYTFDIQGDVRWILETSPVITYLEPNETKTIDLKIIPKKSSFLSGSLGYGAYQIPISIKEDDNLKLTHSIFIYIIPYNLPNMQYRPIVKVDLDFQKEVDPRTPFIIGVTLSNKNIMNLSNINIILSSDLFSKEMNLSLSPLQTKHIDLVVEIPAFASPGIHKFSFMIRYKNETLVYDEYSIIVKEYENILINRTSFSSGFLIKTEKISVKNMGNTFRNVFVPYSTNFLKEMLSSHPAIEKVSLEGKKETGFFVSLNPGEEKEIIIKVYYWPLLVVGLAIILAIILYYLFRSPLVIEKEARAISIGDGIKEIKVTLRVRNRSMKPIFKVNINDFIPKIASFDKNQEFLGTTAPSKVAKHEGLGQRLTWSIDTMEPYEERILTYKIKTRLDVLGTFILPRAKARFETKKGKVRIVSSNQAKI